MNKQSSNLSRWLASVFAALAITLLAAHAAPAQPAPRPQQAAQDAGAPLSADQRKAIVERIATLLEERYVFEDVGRTAGQHVAKLLADGAFDDLADRQKFAERLTAELQSITKDKHMRVRALGPGQGAMAMRPGGAPTRDPAERFINARPPLREGNWGFAKVESLPGNIGYLDIRGFAGDPAARPTAAAAMNFLAGHDALIIDLRKNGGGSPEMIQYMSSWLFDKPTHLNSLYFREGDRTEEFWTFSDIPGKPYADVPLYVLTSNSTFSGGEEFAYNIQTQKRGTLIGETTGGGANPGGVFMAGEGFAIFIPGGRAINPITGTNWEGVGVKPDIDLPADEALDRALELAREAAGQRRQERLARVETLRSDLASALRAAAETSASDQPNPELTAALERAVAGGAVMQFEINLTGYGYMEAGQLGTALALLEFNAERFPESANAHDSLGEVLEKLGRLQEAQAAYRRACELGEAQQDAQLSLYREHLERVTTAIAAKN